jgi:hypothetical protein
VPGPGKLATILNLTILQCLEHAPGSTAGRLDVNNPIEVSGGFTQGLVCGRFRQIAKFAGEM